MTRLKAMINYNTTGQFLGSVTQRLYTDRNIPKGMTSMENYFVYNDK